MATLLVTGALGQLGRELLRAAGERGHRVVGADLPETDITNRTAVNRLVGEVGPDVIVNCAAFTAVDEAEAREAEAVAVNGTAVRGLAEAADAAGALLVQISTDYVFDGRADRPYREDDVPAPLSAYGRSKLVGERHAAEARRHLIVRTAWLYGEGASFVRSIRAQLAAGAGELRVVDDQWGSPTCAADLAQAIAELVEVGAEGTVHAVNRGITTWCGLAGEIVALTGGQATVVPVTTAEVPRPAPRPRFSALDTSRLAKLLGHPLPPWRDALARFLER